SKGPDRDDWKRQETFQPFITKDHAVPVRAWRAAQADQAKDYDGGKWHGDSEWRYSGLAAGPGELCEIADRHTDYRKREHELEDQKDHGAGCREVSADAQRRKHDAKRDSRSDDNSDRDGASN